MNTFTSLKAYSEMIFLSIQSEPKLRGLYLICVGVFYENRDGFVVCVNYNS